MTVDLSMAIRRGAVPSDQLAGTREQRRAWLAKRICEELVHLDLSAGDHVTEMTLADTLGVSRSPVRAALHLLAEHGVLEHRRNQGYFLTRDARTLDGLPLQTGSTPDNALYLSIIDDRLSERLPDRFMQIDLVRRYEVPESRVVSVLSRLREEGLVRRNPGRGWTFEPAINSKQALTQSYAFRLVVEPAALAQPTLSIDRAALARSRDKHLELLKSANRDDLVQALVFEVDASFHEMLAAFPENPFFLEAIRNQNRLRRMLEYLEYTDRQRIGLWCTEHLGIIDALERGHIRKARNLLRAHLERASTSIFNK
ncbi:GntR family transcriptional regulator [Thalassobaculum sp.]|uniref:GntR family transcriptional regulator n=1 Tax=Thalassobaculum sp. TaxID=2022740 RepID=UPI0032EE0855